VLQRGEILRRPGAAVQALLVPLEAVDHGLHLVLGARQFTLEVAQFRGGPHQFGVHLGHAGGDGAERGVAARRDGLPGELVEGRVEGLQVEQAELFLGCSLGHG
jgi:hypothetical protein